MHGPLAYWFSWSIGAWIASAWLNGTTNPLARIPSYIPFLGSIACWFFKPTEPYFFTMASVATGTILCKTLNGKRSGQPELFKKWFQEAMSFIGKISYSLYLLHQPLISLWHKIAVHVLGNTNPNLMFIALLTALVPAIVISWIFYRYIEIPSIALGRHTLARREFPPDKNR